MPTYTLGTKELVINALIEINRVTSRRIIDMSDVIVYQNLLRKRMLENDIEYIDSSNKYQFEDFKEEYKDYIVVLEKETTIISLLPWVSEKDIVKSIRSHLPVKLLLLFLNMPNLEEELDKSPERIKYLEGIQETIEQEYIETLNQHISLYEEKIACEKNKLEESKHIKQLKFTRN
ncbi:MAG: hypothetical protein RSB41_03395 [Bacilli bacterium]